MSTRENIRLIARAPLFCMHYLGLDIFQTYSDCLEFRPDFNYFPNCFNYWVRLHKT